MPHIDTIQHFDVEQGYAAECQADVAHECKQSFSVRLVDDACIYAYTDTAILVCIVRWNSCWSISILLLQRRYICTCICTQNRRVDGACNFMACSANVGVRPLRMRQIALKASPVILLMVKEASYSTTGLSTGWVLPGIMVHSRSTSVPCTVPVLLSMLNTQSNEVH